jgi:hypothetical protein
VRTFDTENMMKAIVSFVSHQKPHSYTNLAKIVEMLYKCENPFTESRFQPTLHYSLKIFECVMVFHNTTQLTGFERTALKQNN